MSDTIGAPEPMLPLAILLKRLADELKLITTVTDRLQHATEALIVYTGAEHFETLQRLDEVHQKLDEISGVLQTLSNRSSAEWYVPVQDVIASVRLNELVTALLDRQEPATHGPHGNVELF